MRIKNIEKQKNVFIEYVFFLKKLKFVEVNLNNNGSSLCLQLFLTETINLAYEKHLSRHYSTPHSETKNEVHVVEGPASVAEATNQT